MASKLMNSSNSKLYLPHQSKILENLDQLVSVINLNSMKRGLITMDIIPFEMLDDIRDLGKREEPKVRKVLQYIATRSLVVFVKFINCLLSTGQNEIVSILEPKLVFVSNPSGDETDAGVNVGKVIYRQPEYVVYPMVSNPRGYALIISNTQFDDPKIYPGRDGGEKDESSIYALLKSFFFTPIIYRNKTKNEMKSILTDFREMDHTASNAVAIVIMSHGEKTGIVGTDGFILSFDSIIENFSSDNCLALAHRPKLFFFQACRGDKKDFGNIALVSNTIKTNGRMADTDGRSLFEEPQLKELAPTYSHIKVCFSSYEGYASMRNTLYGTWFIQAIVSVFGKHARDVPIDELIKMVSKTVREMGTSEGVLQTVHISDIGWERQLYFNPGFYIK